MLQAAGAFVQWDAGLETTIKETDKSKTHLSVVTGINTMPCNLSHGMKMSPTLLWLSQRAGHSCVLGGRGVKWCTSVCGNCCLGLSCTCLALECPNVAALRASWADTCCG